MVEIDYKSAYERQKLARERAEDILETKSRELYEKNQSLLEAYNKLKDQKAQLLHQEKLASIGQLAAGVAHEINNPTGFVKSNVHSLGRYGKNIRQLIEGYDHLFVALVAGELTVPEIPEKVAELKNEQDVQFMLEDLDDLIGESLSGLLRIEDIVKSLKSFARPQSAHYERYSLNDCINNTIKLVWNEIKYKAELHTDLGELPCSLGFPGELSQVVLNLLVNAAHAIDESGSIQVVTRREGDTITLEVRDDGCGIKPEHVNMIFDPFFTTKDVDAGTGLGLSITHGIIKKHRGSIDVETGENEGTAFKIVLPIFEPRNVPAQWSGE